MTWPLDKTDAKNIFYGNFREKSWQAINLTRVIPKFRMTYLHEHGKPRVRIPSIIVHRKCAAAFQAALDEIWEKCQHDQGLVDTTGASDYGGCFNIRRISGSDNWSNHSWACAIDLSPGTNGFTCDHQTTLSNVVINAFKRQGALWGGDYLGRKDPMHFEFVSR